METATAAATAASITFFSFYIYHRKGRRSCTLAAARIAAPAARRTRRRGSLSSLIRSYLTSLGSRFKPRRDEDLVKLVRESGVTYNAFMFQGIRISAASLAALLALLVGFPTMLIMAPLLFGLGYHVPVISLKRNRRLRLERLAGELPEVADLMAVLCYSGESLYRALLCSGSTCLHSSSRRELEALTEHVNLGESTAEALRHAVHHPCREMRRFSRTLLRAEEYGAPIAETLEGLASELRSGRREKERVRAARASILILFPLVFLILPSFLLLTVGGMILGFTH
ncbi:MAG: type II secretion system F family protein [Actinomycetota bacterium]|nr:type II secretion system F family protein [Actinomycetota bacterium]